MRRFYWISYLWLGAVLFTLFTTAEAKSAIDIDIINNCNRTVEIEDAVLKTNTTGVFKITTNKPLTITVLSYPSGYTYSVDLIKTDHVCSYWSELIPNGWEILVQDKQFCAQETEQPDETNVLLILSDGKSGTCHAQLSNMDSDFTEGLPLAGPLGFNIK